MLKTQESLGLVPIRGGFTVKLKSPGAPPLPGSGPSSCSHGPYGFVRYFNCSGLGLLSLHYVFPSITFPLGLGGVGVTTLSCKMVLDG